MSGIKKKVRPLNKVKNEFLQWLTERKAECIDVYAPKNDDDWGFYVHVSAFVDDNLYNVYFRMWNGQIDIDYSDEDYSYKKMSIDDFKQLIW